MSQVKLSRKRRKLPSGDLDSLINLKNRSIKGLAGTVDYTEDFTPNATNVWAAVETVNGVSQFDSSGIERTITHRFYIRFDATVTTETWVEFNGKNYNIVVAENFENRDEYLKLPAYERGVAINPVNFA